MLTRILFAQIIPFSWMHRTSTESCVQNTLARIMHHTIWIANRCAMHWLVARTYFPRSVRLAETKKKPDHVQRPPNAFSAHAKRRPPRQTTIPCTCNTTTTTTTCPFVFSIRMSAVRGCVVQHLNVKINPLHGSHTHRHISQLVCCECSTRFACLTLATRFPSVSYAENPRQQLQEIPIIQKPHLSWL